MKSKRLISMIVSFIVLFTAVSQPISAANIEKRSEEAISIVTAIQYQDVADKIAEAYKTTVVPQKMGNIYYYWGTNL
ncbi:MAG: hypothetical protein K6E30_01695 [Lachnospiraceae bacterium]|nr:hypothetical protein [Lachnospiraceae bacterium]